MHPTNCSPLFVQEMFRSLLRTTPSPGPSTVSHQKLSLSTTPKRLTSPPPKNSIRYIENDQNNRREKYDGHRWRLVCTWPGHECTNLAYTRQLCNKHNALQRNKELPKRKKKPLFTNLSLPICKFFSLFFFIIKILLLVNQHSARAATAADDDDDIEILEEYCTVRYRKFDFNLYF